MTKNLPRKKLTDFNILSIGTTVQLSGVVYSDANGAWVVPFPDEKDVTDKPFEILDMNPAEWSLFLQQTDHLDVEMLAPGEDGKIVKAIVRKSQRQIEQGVSWSAFKRDGFRCRYCSVEGGTQGAVLTVDHLVLWEHGGPSTLDNVLTSCRKCNKTRGNMLYADWIRSDYYKKVSRNLIEFARIANEKVADTLDRIPRQKVRSR
jgi:hypothetical protein